jgi:hypothetical protein
MQVTDILSQIGGLKSMAQELGISESQAAKGAEALTPAILGGLKKQAQSQQGGEAGLGSLLSRLGGGGLLDQVLAPQPTNVSQGNEVLGEIFGSRDVSRAVAQNASSHSGLDSNLLKKMLPILAMQVAGYMSKAHGSGGVAQVQAAQGGGGLGDLLGGLLGGQGGNDSNAAPGAKTSSGFASMLDMNGDGNALDDILRMAGKLTR